MSKRKGITAPLRQRDFRLLFGAQLASNLGDWIDFLGLSVLIAYVWELGPSALAALAIVIAAPWIVIGPFAGVLADRWPKRMVMIGADLARAVLVVGLIFAPNLPVLLVLVGLKTVFSTLFLPAQQASIRFLVKEDQLQAANALSQIVVQSTKVVGPAAGGVLVAMSSPDTLFAIDAATFIISAAILSRLGTVEGAMAAPRDKEGEEVVKPTFRQQLVEGLSYVVRRRALLISMGSFSAVIFLLLAFDSLSPLAFRELGVSRALFGFAIGAIGLGGVLGAVAVGRYGGNVNPFVLLGAGIAVVGGLVAVMGAGLQTESRPPSIVWLPVFLVVGIASAAVLVASPTILQRETPPELMGRVSTTASAVPTVFQLVGPLAGAALAEWKGVGFVFASAGGALALLGLVLLIVRPPVGVNVPGGRAEVVADAEPITATEQSQTVDVEPTEKGAAI